MIFYFCQLQQHRLRVYYYQVQVRILAGIPPTHDVFARQSDSQHWNKSNLFFPNGTQCTYLISFFLCCWRVRVAERTICMYNGLACVSSFLCALVRLDSRRHRRYYIQFYFWFRSGEQNCLEANFKSTTKV